MKTKANDCGKFYRTIALLKITFCGFYFVKLPSDECRSHLQFDVWFMHFNAPLWLRTKSFTVSMFSTLSALWCHPLHVCRLKRCQFVIEAGLRQRTTVRHVGRQSWQAAGDSELYSLARTARYSAASSLFCQILNATELRRQLHWLPIRQRIIYKLAVIITYTIRDPPAPRLASFSRHSSSIIYYQPAHTARSSDKLCWSKW